MDIVRVYDLAPVPRAERSIYDPETGTRLFAEQDPITARGIQALADNGIESVAILDAGETPDTLIRMAQFQTIPLPQIEADMQLAFDIYAADGSLLLARGSPLSQAVMDRMARRRIHEVYVRKSPDRARLARLRQARAVIQQELARTTPPPVQFAASELIEQPGFLTTRTLDDMVRELETVGTLQATPDDDAAALMRFVQFVDAFQSRGDKTKQYYLTLYQNLIAQTARIYNSLGSRSNVNGDLILAMTEQTISALVADRELLLCTIYIPPPSEDYLPHHAVNVSILAVNIGATAGFSPKQVMEIGYGALLSDVGMLSIPQRIRFKEAPLTPNEQLEVMRHTLYGIDRLQLVRRLPYSTPLVGYQSHERVDGSGYPHGKKARTIHNYAKIVAIADVFHAQIAKRPFRPRGRLPYHAIEEVLRMAASKKLDNQYTRCLLSAISLFPVGSWVRLNTGENARVISAHESEFTKPVINILYDAMGRPCSPRRVDLFKNERLRVIAPIEMDNPDDPMVGF